MKVFLSWSGERSRKLADILRTWLSDVIHAAEPWVSSRDIGQGSRWGLEVAGQLELAEFGVLCVTRENLEAPWLLFEAGALAKKLDQPNVCPYLFDLKPSDLKGPLSQFQCCEATETDTRKLVHSINKNTVGGALGSEQINRSFDKWWPDLELGLSRLKTSIAIENPLRSEREILEELVERIRRIDQIGNYKHSYNDYYLDSILNCADAEILWSKFDKFTKIYPSNRSPKNVNFSQKPHDLDGFWHSAWNGGVSGHKWTTGIANVCVLDSFIFVLHYDQAFYLIGAKLDPDGRAFGNYINTINMKEYSEWCGKVISKNRIDGVWGHGQWNLWR